MRVDILHQGPSHQEGALESNETRDRPSSRPPNQLLTALPEADFQRIAPLLATVSIEHKQTLYSDGDPIEYVYFPNGGVVSVTTAMADGTTVETATIGVEGMVGIEALLGGKPISPGQTVVQVPDGTAERMTVAALRTELARGGAAFRLFGSYSQVVIAQMMQTAACNALHTVHERCARWLLMTHDRVRRDQFDLSQEYLASMLGVRRSSVTVVAGGLQAAGIITYHHGRMTILDRAALEDSACECYRIIRDRYAVHAVDLRAAQTA